MKKFYFLAAMMLLVSISMCAANYITIGEDVRVHPRYLDGYYQVTAVMEADGMLDSWNINTEWPKGVIPKLVAGIQSLDGMYLHYTDRYGMDKVLQAPLQASVEYGTISSEVTTLGYWDVDGDDLYDTYGTVKWMPGTYELFTLNLDISPEYRDGYIGWYGVLTSGADQRGAVLQGVRFAKPCHLWVGYPVGDVSGNETLNVDDVTMLISYVLNGSGNLDEFGIVAADVNGDGNVTIADVTMLIGRVLSK